MPATDVAAAARALPRGAERLRREIVVPRPLEAAFTFFSDAENLNRITPPTLGFTILTPTPIEMRAGTLIDYRIRIHGIPMRWRTEIKAWEPPYRFVDVQIKGPYRLWRHEHRLEACDGGTRVIDEVDYLAPLHWLTHTLLVRREVNAIFDFRAQALQRELA